MTFLLSNFQLKNLLKVSNKMTNENELKVGDVISVYMHSNKTWICERVLRVQGAYFETFSFKEPIQANGLKIFKGIHPSLIPEGFTLIKEEDRQALIMSLANKVDVIEAKSKELEAAKAEIEAVKKDVTRIDFLASTEQFICNVQMPREIVEANLTSLRDAIDVCMAQTKKPEESK